MSTIEMNNMAGLPLAALSQDDQRKCKNSLDAVLSMDAEKGLLYINSEGVISSTGKVAAFFMGLLLPTRFANFSLIDVCQKIEVYVGQAALREEDGRVKYEEDSYRTMMEKLAVIAQRVQRKVP